MELKVGDTILYGNKDNIHEDIVEEEITKRKKKIYYGKYSVTNAISLKRTSLKELLEDYLDLWEEVSIIRNGKETIVKSFSKDVKRADIILERTFNEITIKILELNGIKYYTEFKNNELILYERI